MARMDTRLFPARSPKKLRHPAPHAQLGSLDVDLPEDVPDAANAFSPGGSPQEKDVETLLGMVLTSDDIPSNNRRVSCSVRMPEIRRWLRCPSLAPRVLVERAHASLFPMCRRVPKAYNVAVCSLLPSCSLMNAVTTALARGYSDATTTCAPRGGGGGLGRDFPYEIWFSVVPRRVSYPAYFARIPATRDRIISATLWRTPQSSRAFC